MKNKEKITEYGTKIFAIIGVVAVLVLFVWAGTQAVRSLPENFSKSVSNTLLAAVSNVTSIFVSSEEKNPILFNTTTHSIDAQVPFALDWEHETDLQGNYFFHYKCIPGLNIERVNIDGTNSKMLCESPLNLFGEKTITFEVVQTEGRFVDIPVSVSFIPQSAGAATTQGSILFTVTNTEKPTVPENSDTDVSLSDEGSTQTITAGTEKNETQIIDLGDTDTTSNNIQPSNPLGTPDLAVSVIATGVIDTATNDFTAFTTVENNQRAAIRFKIENVGTKATGPWTFTVQLPLSTTDIYVYRPTDKQPSLNPGERIEYTLGFDSVDRSTSTVDAVINIDTIGEIPETNRENNVGIAVISVQTN